MQPFRPKILRSREGYGAMSSSEQRGRIAQSILNFEARRDSQGRIAIYELPSVDGGGTYEVAGINDRYHPEQARRLADLIRAGRYQDAEAEAREFIAKYTDVVAPWCSITAIEAYLRDSAFNRGPRGAARILQRAVGADDDGFVGPQTLEAIRAAEVAPRALLNGLRQAREQYERQVVGRDETSIFWNGLVNRWNKARDFAEGFLASAPPIHGSVSPFDAAIAATHEMASSAATAPVGYAPLVIAMSEPSVTGAPVSLPALRLGSRGDLVRTWQSFLLGQAFDPGGLDGHFGEKTQAATKAFQGREGLVADGIAGRQTLRKAMELGFELIEEPAADTSGSNFPPRPNFGPLVSTAARQAVFGAFDYVPEPKPGNRENIRILGDWEANNIVRVEIPELRKALGANAPSGMRFHRLAAEQLRALWSAWDKENLLDRILSFEGSYVPRFIRGSTSVLSNHAFGSAFDINARWNGLGVRPALVGEKGCVRELVEAANKHGFYWGGHFGSRPDGMHFEVAFVSG